MKWWGSFAVTNSTVQRQLSFCSYANRGVILQRQNQFCKQKLSLPRPHLPLFFIIILIMQISKLGTLTQQAVFCCCCFGLFVCLFLFCFVCCCCCCFVFVFWFCLFVFRMCKFAARFAAVKARGTFNAAQLILSRQNCFQFLRLQECTSHRSTLEWQQISDCNCKYAFWSAKRLQLWVSSCGSDRQEDSLRRVRK